ncbi:MAG: hypothetical protein ACLUD2_13110 [Clostridium sp.]
MVSTAITAAEMLAAKGHQRKSG